MSDTLQEQEDRIPAGTHKANASGNCSISGCPCHGWSEQSIASTEQLASAAVGESSIAQLRRVCDQAISDYRALLTEHHSLRRQNERLRDALGEMLNRFYPHTCDRSPLCAKCGALRAAQSVFNEADEQKGQSQ